MVRFGCHQMATHDMDENTGLAKERRDRMERNFKLRRMIYGKYASQAALAGAMGWTRQKLNNIVNGRTMPDVRDVNTLATSLEVPVSEILDIFLHRESPNE